MGVERRRSHSLVVGAQPGQRRSRQHEPSLLCLRCPLLINPPCQWATGAEKFPGQLRNGGTNLDSCLLQLADKLKPYMKTGIPSLNIPKTDPMDIDRISFQLKNPLGVVTVKFTENTVEGLSTHTINSIRANKAAKTLSMEIHVPKATARGRSTWKASTSRWRTSSAGKLMAWP